MLIIVSISVNSDFPENREDINSVMISLFHARCSTLLSRAGNLVSHSHSCRYLNPSGIATLHFSGVRTVKLVYLVTRSQVQCYSSKKSGGASSRRKSNPKPVMDNDEFFVVRKGDLVGVYRSLSDCQAQVGTSVVTCFQVLICDFLCIADTISR